MNDLISRKAAIDAICRDGVRLERGGALMITISTAKQWAVDLLDKLPSAQPKIVYCMDCEHLKLVGGNASTGEGIYYCTVWHETAFNGIAFCSYGKRREVSE